MVPTDLREKRHIPEPAQLTHDTSSRDLRSSGLRSAESVVDREPAGHVIFHVQAFNPDGEAERKVRVVQSDVDEMPIHA